MSTAGLWGRGTPNRFNRPANTTCLGRRSSPERRRVVFRPEWSFWSHEWSFSGLSWHGLSASDRAPFPALLYIVKNIELTPLIQTPVLFTQLNYETHKIIGCPLFTFFHIRPKLFGKNVGIHLFRIF
jgi:hypothetical protein